MSAMAADPLTITAPTVTDAPDECIAERSGYRLVELPAGHPGVRDAWRYCASEIGMEGPMMEDGRAFAWLRDDRLVAAALIDTDDDGPYLDWAWVHPTQRRLGLMRGLWAEMRRLFGVLGTSEVVTAQMNAFYLSLPASQRPPEDAP